MGQKTINKHIFALATPYAMGAIHIIRVSGPNVYSLMNKICKKKIVKKGFCIERNQIVDKKNQRIIDDVLLMKYVAPRSYTGEDLIEINCHGSLQIVNDIFALLQSNGFELATAGEFTKRAFLNGKLDLNQAASVDLIVKTQNRYVRDVAMNSLLGVSSKEIEKLQFNIFKLIGMFEIAIDYPEYEEGMIDFAKVKKELISIKNKLTNILESSRQVLSVQNGIKIAIVGKPNTGKSTLMNALLNRERSIVSNVAGTTRDVIESNVEIGPFNAVLLDTAGIHKHRSQLELQGINKTLKSIQEADLVIFLLQPKSSLDTQEKWILEQTQELKKDVIVCYNKIDLLKDNNKKSFKPMADSVSISAKNKKIQPLIDKVIKKLEAVNFASDTRFLISDKWQLSILEHAINSVKSFIDSVQTQPYVDILIEPLKEANESLLKILGKIQDYDLMDEIFKNFCLGK